MCVIPTDSQPLPDPRLVFLLHIACPVAHATAGGGSASPMVIDHCQRHSHPLALLLLIAFVCLSLVHVMLASPAERFSCAWSEEATTVTFATPHTSARSSMLGQSSLEPLFTILMLA